MADVFRTLPLRALGYGFAAGEALIYVTDLGVVDGCYSVATAFCVVHVVYATIKQTDGNALESFIKTVLFEGFASALIPTFLVYWASRLTFRFVSDNRVRPVIVRTWAPTLVGFLLMPFIMMPIDDTISQLLSDIFK